MEHTFRVGDRVAVVEPLPIYEELQRGTVVGFFRSYVLVRLDHSRTAMVKKQKQEAQLTHFQPDELVLIDA